MKLYLDMDGLLRVVLSTIVQVSQVKSCLLDCQHELFEVCNIEPFSAFDKVQRSVHRLLDGSPDEL